MNDCNVIPVVIDALRAKNLGCYGYTRARAKGFPNILLILSPNHSSLVKAFNRYANVFAYFIDPWSFAHIIHRIPGWVKAKYRSFPTTSLKFVGRLLNPPHRIATRQLNSAIIDLVFVSDPITCKIDLKPFKNAVKAYWSQDCVYPSSWYTQVLSTQIQGFDVIFCAHKRYLCNFEGVAPKVYHLPFAYDPDVCKPMNALEKYDIAFVGTLTQNRDKVIRELKKRLPNLHIFVGNAWQHDMARIYNESRMVLNISRSAELNWRVFEALGCKRLLLTDRSQEVEELFRDKEHLVIYDSIEDLVYNIEEYIANREEKERIALQGFKEVAQKHTIYHRAEEVLKVFEVM